MRLTVVILLLSLSAGAQVPKSVKGLQWSLVALEVADVATTWYGINKKGLAEGNPIMRPMTSLGVMIPVKASATYYLIRYTRRHYADAPRLTIAALVLVNAGQAAVLANNAYQISITIKP